MVYHWCIVPMCTNTSVKTPQKTFINVPKSGKMRRLWINAVRRDPKEFAVSTVLFVCEDHFKLEEDMANYMEWKLTGVKKLMKKDVVPHLFACQKDRKRSFPQGGPRSAALKRIRRDLINEAMTEPSPSTSTSAAEETPEAMEHQSTPLDVSCEGLPLFKEIGIQVNIKPQYRSKYVQCNIKMSTICQSCSPIKLDSVESLPTLPGKTSRVKNSIPVKLSSSESQSHSSQTSEYESPACISEDDSLEIETSFKEKTSLRHTVTIIEKNPRRYLGIPGDVFFIVVELQNLTGLDTTSIYLTLKKIRVDQTFAELGDDFGVSEATASRLFSKSLLPIAKFVSGLIVWPSPEKIAKLLPIPFRARYGKVQAIIDCLEIEIQKPEDAVKQSLTWSEYKKCNTVKYLVSSTPDGIVNFISNGFGGRTSDAVIVEESGFLDKLVPGCYVMADRGFKHIDKLLTERKCVLVRPPSVRIDEKLSKSQVLETKKIASLRIHIERVIRRLREFRMLKPHSCIHFRLIPYTDDIMKIACGLINLQGPLIVGDK
ncbi:uncharacterized protein LOC116165155 [Photinus pyralis]|nr:uncharacterized protein LOC116165155 [Photinus pyralis]